MATKTDRAILAGGCFWGMQQLIRRRPGVSRPESAIPVVTCRTRPPEIMAPTLRQSRSSSTRRDDLPGSARVLLPDPRSDDAEPPGNDRGTSYRSAIFYTSDEQRRTAEDTIADVNASGLWPGRVVTDVAPASDFWEAEREHQDYLERIPGGYTCHFARPEWKLPRRNAA